MEKKLRGKARKKNTGKLVNYDYQDMERERMGMASLAAQDKTIYESTHNIPTSFDINYANELIRQAQDNNKRPIEMKIGYNNVINKEANFKNANLSLDESDDINTNQNLESKNINKINIIKSKSIGKVEEIIRISEDRISNDNINISIDSKSKQNINTGQNNVIQKSSAIDNDIDMADETQNINLDAINADRNVLGLKKINQIFCSKCKSFNKHITRYCPMNFCNICLQFGHISNDCIKKPNICQYCGADLNKLNNPTIDHENFMKCPKRMIVLATKCYKCGRYGHTLSNCTFK